MLALDPTRARDCLRIHTSILMQQRGSPASRLNMSDTVIIPGALHKLNMISRDCSVDRQHL